MIKSYQTLRGLDPEYIEKLRGRFWAKVHRAGGDDCWEWQAAVASGGYGSIGVMAGKTQLAHRVSYELNIGAIPAGMLVCHKCDNRRCVRPDHFFLGSDADNVKDAVKKGRLVPPEPGNKKLTADQVVQMRHEFKDGIGATILAEKYQVSKETVRCVVHGRLWQTTPGPIAPSGMRAGRFSSL